MAFQQHSSFLLICLTLFVIMQILEAGNTKIAYKKPLYGKTYAINEKYMKLKRENERRTAQQSQQTTATNNPLLIANDGTSTTTTTTTSIVTENLQQIPHINADYNVTSITTAAPKSLITNPTTTTTTTTTIMPSSTPSNLPAYCTCGIFLSSQIQRGKSQNAPVITYELDRVYPCNVIGQRQCQTKCLEKIVQHLPNAANILCATLDRDCRKERAYLFVKNCSHTWWNTSLAAGREYCCKNGQPYQCPFV